MSTYSLILSNNFVTKNRVHLLIKNKKCHAAVRAFAVSAAFRLARRHRAALRRERHYSRVLKRQVAELKASNPKVIRSDNAGGGGAAQGYDQSTHPHTTIHAREASKEKIVFTDTGTTPVPLQKYKEYKERNNSSAGTHTEIQKKDTDSHIIDSKPTETKNTGPAENISRTPSEPGVDKKGGQKTKSDADIPEKRVPVSGAESLPKTEHVVTSTNMPIESGMKKAENVLAADYSEEIMKATISTAKGT